MCQDISSVDDQSACSIPMLANYSSKRIQIIPIESVGHHSAEVASIEDNVTYWFDDLRNSSISKCYGKVTTEQPFIAINIERFV